MPKIVSLQMETLVGSCVEEAHFSEAKSSHPENPRRGEDLEAICAISEVRAWVFACFKL